MPAAKLITNREFDEWIEELEAGTAGERNFLVHTGDSAEALTASMLPAIGDAWDDTRPGLKVRSRRTFRWMQGGLEMGGRPGAIRVRISYQTDNLSVISGPRADEVWTSIGGEDQSITQFYEILITDDTVVGPNKSRLNDGQGVTKEIGFTVLSVSKAYPRSMASTIDLSRRIQLRAKKGVNDAPITFPRVSRVDGLEITLSAGEARYRNFFLEEVGDLVVVTDEFLAAASHVAIFQTVDDDGLAMEKREAIIYQNMDLDGLW